MALPRVAPWLGCLLLVACTDEGALGRRRDALAVPGPWQIPSATLALGDTQYVAYEGAGPWLGEQGCAGGLLPGTELLGAYLAERFAQISMVGGYACRPIRGTTETMSLHGAGRALDLHIPEIGEPLDADNELGDDIGAFLIEHAELLGVQLIIWDEWSWGASRAVGDKGRAYGGVNPHHDHLHVELSVAAAAREEDWFSAMLPPPDAADASLDAAMPNDASDVALDDAGTDASAPRPPEPPAVEPKQPRPVIEPELDDDPLPDQATRASSQPMRTHLVGSTCSAAPALDRDGWLALLLMSTWAMLIQRRTR